MDLTNVMVANCGVSRFAFLPERAVLEMSTLTLYLADLHIGKSASFRAKAIPIPEGDTGADLQRLTRAIERTGATRIVILGDFLHAASSHLDTQWKAWRREHADIPITVVRGNHDLTAGDPSPDWGVKLVEEPATDGPLVLRHHPEVSKYGFVLAGHLHPAVRLRGSGRDNLSLPCFHLASRVLVLPAFTQFSGGHPVSPRRGDRVFAIAEDSVLDVTALVL
jgi:uncharacterized protein